MVSSMSETQTGHILGISVFLGDSEVTCDWLHIVSNMTNCNIIHQWPLSFPPSETFSIK